MHLAETYSLSCGLKISSPQIQELFYPVGTDKYVVFHFSAKDQIRHYDYYHDVVSMVKPFLNNSGYKIVQVGVESDHKIESDIDLRGKTSMRQMAYVIKNCELFFGVDSFPTHLAGYYNKKIVSIYSNNFKECVKPYWGDAESQYLVDPSDYDDTWIPSFSAQENPKTINKIPPEKLSNKILNFLNIDNTFNKVETIYSGKAYSDKVFEIIPNFVPSSLPKATYIVRMDYEFNEQILLEYAKKFDFQIVTDKPISLEILSSIRQRVKQLLYRCSPETDKAYLLDIQRLEIPLYTFSRDIENISEIRMNLFPEFNIWIVEKENLTSFSKENLDIVTKFGDNTYFTTNKFIASKGKVYSSKAHLKRGIEFAGRPQSVFAEDEFFEEIDYCRIFNQN